MFHNIPRKTPVLGSLFDKVVGLSCNPGDTAKFFGLAILKNICKWLFLDCSMVHCYMGLKFKVYIVWQRQASGSEIQIYFLFLS